MAKLTEYRGVNGEKVYNTNRTKIWNNYKFYEYFGDYIYLYDKINNRWYYIDENDKLQRFFQPYEVKATKKTSKILLFAGLGLMLFSIKN